MPIHTSRRRKSTWTSKRNGKTITVRATKKVWQVKRQTPSKKLTPFVSPKAYIRRIEITPKGKLWRVVAKDGYGNLIKSKMDLDIREVAKTATGWQKRHKFEGKEIPITLPKLKKKVSKK